MSDPIKPDPVVGLGNAVNALTEKIAKIEKDYGEDSLIAKIAAEIKKHTPAPAPAPAPVVPPAPAPVVVPPDLAEDMAKWMRECPLTQWIKK
jgi:hypothetical protein